MPDRVSALRAVTLPDAIIRSTVWASLACYTAALFCRFGPTLRLRFAQTMWSLGAALFVAHVLSAYGFVHGFSHTDAVRVTAERTREMTGWDWGGGVYLNDLMTLLWVADAIWWRMAQISYQRRPMSVELTLHGFFLFMIFNATVVFGAWPARIYGAILCPIIMWLLYRATRNSPRFRRANS